MSAKPTCEELGKRVFELQHGILQSTDTYDSLAWSVCSPSTCWTGCRPDLPISAKTLSC